MMNSIYEAIGSVDDKFVCEAAAVRRKRPIMLVVVAVAAALATFVGFSPKIGNGRNTIIIGDNEAAIALDLRAKNIIIPEKYLVTSNFYGRQMEMTPSELVAEFGVEPLGIHNDNFSEEIDFEPNPVRDGKTGELLWTYNGEPQLLVNYDSVEFTYYLQSKSLGRHIRITAEYITDDRHSSGGNIGVSKNAPYKLIKLNNHRDCYVDRGGAIFSYDGVFYKFGIPGHNDGREESLEENMQILRDLGVL